MAKRKSPEQKAFEANLKALRKSIDELNEKRRRLFGDYLGKLLGPFFEKHPWIEEISWSAHTPYFNDGEQCEFASYHEHPDFNGEDCYEHPDGQAACDDFVLLMSPFTTEELREFFGDHVKVRATRDDFTVESHTDHD